MSKGKSRSRIMLERYKETIKSRGYVNCGICLLPISYLEDLTVDHIRPRARGGNSRLDNLQPAHQRCNVQKGDKIINFNTSPTPIERSE